MTSIRPTSYSIPASVTCSGLDVVEKREELRTVAKHDRHKKHLRMSVVM